MYNLAFSVSSKNNSLPQCTICNSSTQLGDNIILHTMNSILSVSVCEISFFLHNLFWRPENVLNNVLMIANNKKLLLFQKQYEKMFHPQVFCRSFFVKCVSTENNKALPTISDKCSVFWMCDLTRARIGTLMQCKICLWKVTEMHISVYMLHWW